MIDFKALLAEEKTLGKNAAAAYRVDAFEKIDRQLDSIRDEEKLMELTVMKVLIILKKEQKVALV